MSYPYSFKNVLHVGPNYRCHRGGIGAVLSTYENNIAEFNFIATYDGNYSMIKNIFFYVKSLFSLFFKLITRNELKIIHMHGASNGSFYRKYLLFLICKYIFRKTIVYHLHGGGFAGFYFNSNSIIKKLIIHLFKEVDHVICLSHYWRMLLLELFPMKAISVIKNPIEPPLNLHDLSKNNSRLTLLFLGRIDDNKGIFDLLQVLKENRNRYEGKVVLRIGGNGNVKKLQRFITDCELKEIVTYEGWVTGSKKHKLLCECDSLVLPSYNEGLPVSILEAMSYGKAIIATNVGGIPEVLKNDENGYIIEPGDLSSLRLAIDNLKNKNQLLEAFGKKSLLISQDYRIDLVAKELQKIYTELNRRGSMSRMHL